jgi:hypothetical protein
MSKAASVAPPARRLLPPPASSDDEQVTIEIWDRSPAAGRRRDLSQCPLMPDASDSDQTDVAPAPAASSNTQVSF